MPIIDTYTLFGACPAGGADLSLERLRHALAGRDISAAIAHTTESVFQATAETLRSTYHQVSQVPGLSPAAVLNPAMMSRPWEFAQAIVGQPWACVRFFPDAHGWPIADYSPFEKCMEVLAPSGMPVSVSISRPGMVTALSRVSHSAEAKISLVHVATECLSEVEAVLPAMENWTLSTDGLTHLGMLEELVSVVGAEKIIFGSTAPRGSIEGSIRYVKHSHLTDAAKEAIFNSNALRVFGGRIGNH